MIDVETARGLLIEAVRPPVVVEADLDDALGRVLAADVAADRDHPPADRSAMDGFAVRAADLPDVPRELRLAGELRAGQPATAVRVGPGEAVRIFTGAVVPPGADTVVMVETTEEDEAAGTVRFRERPRAGQHIRRRGEELRRGETVLRAGSPIGAPEIAALADVGRTRVPVYRTPRVHVLSTGDEIIEPDRVPADHQVRNSNAPMLAALLAECGVRARLLATVADERAALRETLRAGLAGDLLLVTGGVSVGAYDLVREMLEADGLAVLFHGVAIRPGKPVLAGRVGECLVVGLPGNPVSAFTGFLVLVAPALLRMMGHAAVGSREVRVTLAEALPEKRGRTTYRLARVEWRDDGWVGRGIRSASSGDVLSLARANAFLVTPPDAGPLAAGRTVRAMLWKDYDLRGEV